MKTKTKMIAMLEIAIVLFSMFLVATLPGIAAEQNQEMQKASASEVTSSEHYNYALDCIYGNANEDDTIDMGDVVYTKLAIFGKKPKTELCDAKYDGRINVLDVIQTKLIILGKEKELTLIDYLDRTVTLDMPIERVVVTEDKIGEVIRVLGLEDTVVGIDPNMEHLDGLFPVMGDKPHVGMCGSGELDYELIAELDPDLVIIHGYYSLSQLTIEPLESIGMKVIAVDNYLGYSGDDGEPIDGRDIDLTADSMVHCFRTLGMIFNRDEKAQEFLDWRTTKLEMIMERTEDLEEGEMLDAFLGMTFYPGDCQSVGDGRKEDISLDMAGLRNINEVYGIYEVDPELIATQDPDFVFMTGYGSYTGDYVTTEPSTLEQIIDTVSNRPEFSQTTAVTNGDVYVISGECTDMRPWIGAAYMGKVAYPDRFEGINPDEIAEEYFEEWVRVPYQGIFFWPEP